MHTVTCTVTSFNCKNLKLSVEEIQSLCNRCDVLLLQETWLLDFELSLLASIRKDFYGKGVSAIDSRKGIFQGRPHGGLVILWRKSLCSNAVPCMYDDSRIMGIEIGGYNSTILVVNTYLPCSSESNLDMFNVYLNKLDSIVLTSNTVCSIVMGDFNADIKADSKGHHNLLGIKRGDSISAAFVNACKDNFNMIRRKSVYNVIVRLAKSTNAVVTSILQYCLLCAWKSLIR